MDNDAQRHFAAGWLLGDDIGGGTTVLNGLCQKIVTNSRPIQVIFDDGTYKITAVIVKEDASELNIQTNRYAIGVQSMYLQHPMAANDYMMAIAFTTNIYYALICYKNNVPFCVSMGTCLLQSNGTGTNRRYLKETTVNGVKYYYDAIYYTFDINDPQTQLSLTNVHFNVSPTSAWLGGITFEIVGTIKIQKHNNHINGQGQPYAYNVQDVLEDIDNREHTADGGRPFDVFFVNRVIPNYDYMGNIGVTMGELINAVNVANGYTGIQTPTRYISETGQILDHIPSYQSY